MEKEMKKRYETLCREIERHTKLYYEDDSPEISDFEFDTLMKELKQLEKEYPEFTTSQSPTQKVGGKRVIGIPVQHEVPMLSLEDVFDKAEVVSFVEDVQLRYPNAEFVVETKIDGLSLSLEYFNGKLIRASTRGDGHEGEDVTENVRMLKDVPLTINCGNGYDSSGYFEVRGECYMSYSDFEITNQKQEASGKKLFANPRNCAAGTLRQADPEIVKERGLSAFIFNVQNPNDELRDKNHYEQMFALSTWGFKKVSGMLCKTPGEVLTAIDTIGNLRASLGYGIDGAVIKVNSIGIREKLGERTKTPKWAVAFKYPPEEKQTVLREIQLQTGRTGRVTPVAIFDPVMLAGTTVTNATLHNQGRIDELRVAIGDSIVVRKAGDIIPEIVKVVEKGDPDRLPYKILFCPVCGAKVAREQEDGADLYCTNETCPAKLSRRIEFFGSKDCMDIDGLGKTTVDLLIEKANLQRPSDLFHLAYEQVNLPFDALLEKVIGSEKIASKLANQIRKSRSQSAVRVLKSLGWRNVGSNVSTILLRKYGSITALFATPVKKLREDLCQISGLGDVLIESVVSMVESPEIQSEVDALASWGVNMEYAEEKMSDSLQGKTFVITGTLPTLSRNEAKELIERNGGKVSGAVSKKTDYLLTGEAAGSKLTKAQELGIKILTEEEIKEMVGIK